MQPEMSEPELVLERLPSNVAVLRLLGEWDLANASDLGVAAIDALGGSDALVVDLSRTAFVDSTVIHVLLRARKLALDEGKPMIVELQPAAIVHRALRVTGVLDQLPVVESDAQALLLVTGGEWRSPCPSPRRYNGGPY